LGAPAAWLSDKIGRRRCIQFGNVILVASTILQASSQNVTTFAIGRFFIGVGLEFCAVSSPVLITELAYPTHRGKITSLYNTFFFVGAIFSSWTTFGTFSMKSSWAWRIPSLLQGFVPTVQFFCLFFTPESPRWLIGKNRIEEARAVLVKYHAGGQEDSPLVEFELSEITNHLLVDQEVAKMGWLKVRPTTSFHSLLKQKGKKG
jgi:MFS family permease